MTNLEPCPFCGNAVGVELWDFGHNPEDPPVAAPPGWRVRCLRCDAFGPFGADRCIAEHMWNRALRPEKAPHE